MRELLSFIGNKFNISGNIYSYEKINNGLINESFKVIYSGEKYNNAFLFQKINRNAFVNFSDVMTNITKVTSYLRSHYPEEKTLYFYVSQSGKNYYETDEGGIWRISEWIESEVFRTTNELSYIKEAGRAYGHFLKKLSGLDINTLSVTVPDFHNTKIILDRFISTVNRLNSSEICGSEKEIEYLCSNYNKLTAVSEAYAAGKVPFRAVHNDTKLSNILFSVNSCKAEAVIDLDTVMPGMSVYDYGDGIRSAAGKADPETGSVFFDTEKFTSFSEGYLSETSDIMTDTECSMLVPAAYSVTAELSARYFIDYFTDSHYFRTVSPKELLTKAILQAKLSEIILKRSDTLSEIISLIDKSKQK